MRFGCSVLGARRGSWPVGPVWSGSVLGAGSGLVWRGWRQSGSSRLTALSITLVPVPLREITIGIFVVVTGTVS